MSASTEETPLLAPKSVELKRNGISPYHRVLFAAFLLAFTCSFPWTTIVFLYRTFNCEEYYKDPTHPRYTGPGDACAVGAIEAVTARDISLMGVIGTISGTLNLFFTAWQIRHWGVRAALVQQSIWPTFRNACQMHAVLFTEGRVGIAIVQASQLFGLLGGNSGYLLVVNSYIAEVVEPEQRTAAFGVLAGMVMLGTAFGYVVGGATYELISLFAPFAGTFSLLVISVLFNAFLLPYIPPAGSAANEAGAKSRWAFLAGLVIFVPAKYENRSGRFWGLSLLALGAFFAVLATQYVPMMLQLTATNRYGYTPGDNGRMMSLNAISRAGFLTFVFPWIIKTGRVWSDARRQRRASTVSINEPTVDSEDAAAVDKMRGSGFDLEFVRWSILVDAVVTALVGLNSQSWHMLAAATILPLASGTAPAAKGVLTAIVPDARRSDALAGIAIVETFALVLTVSLFGALFAFLSTIGHPNLVFAANASLALIAATILFTVHFPKGLLKSS
ncbi:major facilitator superfamily domain-containing protein [Mycena metata]|uniref:Major facilitator superfamily domain-containing protein n=1 Tax=Mycena metata TaxID=1033252 RepID=A0AAD7MFT0_9AGAR|nr:major facilitator superfamily domain-containing protein [Mycena metata]